LQLPNHLLLDAGIVLSAMDNGLQLCRLVSLLVNFFKTEGNCPQFFTHSNALFRADVMIGRQFSFALTMGIVTGYNANASDYVRDLLCGKMDIKRGKKQQKIKKRKEYEKQVHEKALRLFDTYLQVELSSPCWTKS
jgi:hypothetical protein